MRKLAGMVAATAVAFHPAVTLAQLPSGTTSPLSRHETSVFDVNPGDDIVIACTAVEKRAAASDVRVVLTISAEPGSPAAGFSKVLAMDEQVLNDAVRVRIPDLPNLADRTVGVDVYVVDSGIATHCGAGQVKIS